MSVLNAFTKHITLNKNKKKIKNHHDCLFILIDSEQLNYTENCSPLCKYCNFSRSAFKRSINST